MAHSVGALLLPAPAASGAHGDPGLDILAAYFKAVLESWLAASWLERAPGEPIVRTLETHDPEESDFSDNDLPILFVYRDGDAAPKRLADGYQETENDLNILWIPPPADQFKKSDRYPFFNAFDKAISAAVFFERHPAYVHASQSADPGAIAYGSDVQALAKIDWWRLNGSVQRARVDIPTGSGIESYVAYLATLRIAETLVPDVTQFGVEPSVIGATINSGGESPLDLQTILIPQDADE